MRDAWIIELEWLTRGVRAIRIARFGYREQEMALELKGLKAKAMTARANIGKLDAAYEAFNAKAGNHVSDVEGLTEQLGEMTEDLSFVTTTLGNSVAASNAGRGTQEAELPKPTATLPANDLTAAPQIATAPAAADIPPAVGEQPAATFPGQ
jgi:hypothetical protein